MKTKFWLLVGCLALLAALFRPATTQASPALVTEGYPGWRQVNEDGFGDPHNAQIASLVEFNHYLYAGVWKATEAEPTSEIWRSPNGLDWEKAGEGFGDGVSHMAVFNGILYAASWDGNVYTTNNGTDWDPMVTGGFDGTGQGIGRFQVYGDRLYASTWSGTGTEIWRTSGSYWSPRITDGFEDANNHGAISSAVFEGLMYYGTVNDDTGGQIWRTGGVDWWQMEDDGFGHAENLGISALEEFQGRLYAAVYNDIGVEVWYAEDGTEWDWVVKGGFGNADNRQAAALETYRDRLYLVTANNATGLEVWSTLDGEIWQQEAAGGFGDAANNWTYWDSATIVFQDRLFVATNNFTTGGEIWQKEVEVFIPQVQR